MQALVEPSGRIAQIVADGEDFPIHPGLQWIDAPAGVTTDHTWDGTQFVAPPAPPPEPSLREKIIARLRGDPAARAQAIETRDRLGLTTAQMLDLLEAKAQESV